MSAPSLPAPNLAIRRAHGLRGLNTTVLGLEIRRLLRNRRTVAFAVISPVAFFLLFGLNKAYASQHAGHGKPAPREDLGVDREADHADESSRRHRDDERGGASR